MNTAHTTSPSTKKHITENPFVNLMVNIVFPSVILNRFSSPEKFGPQMAMLVALSLPVAYGAWEFLATKKHNFISILGFVSILLTGGLGLLHVDGVWYAAKEAAIPGIIALVTIGSLFTKKPLVKLMLYNEKVINVGRVDQALAEHNAIQGFEKLMSRTTLVLAASFVLSAILNFILAIVILKSPAGTQEFNEELGKMTALSYPVIVVPSLLVMMIAVWMLVKGIRTLTGLELEAIMASPAPK